MKLTRRGRGSKYKRLSEQVAKERKIEQLERERLLALINSVADGVIALDAKQKIVEYNGAALNLLDVNESIVGRTFANVINIVDKDQKKLNINKIIDKTEVPMAYNEWLLKYKDGETINIYISIAPVHLGYGKKGDQGHVLLLRDITKEKSLEEERDEFISVVSHELRTPIAIAEGGVSNALFVSKKAGVKSSVTKVLKEAHNQIVFLASMVNDLATLSRAERSGAKLEIATVNPGELLEQIAKDYEDEAKNKKLQLTLSVSKQIAEIQTSELYLREILQNFITNSIKYTKKGSVLLHVRSGKNGEAIFSVADTGIGISKSDKKKVFDKFFRSEDYRTRESSGTGLGLYVTAKLASKLKAKIELESELNKGSTFTISVPSLGINS